MIQIAIAVLSVLMIVSPKSVVKREDKENEEKKAKLRRNGIIVLVIDLIAIGIDLIKYF